MVARLRRLFQKVPRSATADESDDSTGNKNIEKQKRKPFKSSGSSSLSPVTFGQDGTISAYLPPRGIIKPPLAPGPHFMHGSAIDSINKAYTGNPYKFIRCPRQPSPPSTPTSRYPPYRQAFYPPFGPPAPPPSPAVVDGGIKFTDFRSDVIMEKVMRQLLREDTTPKSLFASHRRHSALGRLERNKEEQLPTATMLPVVTPNIENMDKVFFKSDPCKENEMVHPPNFFSPIKIVKVFTPQSSMKVRAVDATPENTKVYNDSYPESSEIIVRTRSNSKVRIRLPKFRKLDFTPRLWRRSQGNSSSEAEIRNVAPRMPTKSTPRNSKLVDNGELRDSPPITPNSSDDLRIPNAYLLKFPFLLELQRRQGSNDTNTAPNESINYDDSSSSEISFIRPPLKRQDVSFMAQLVKGRHGKTKRTYIQHLKTSKKNTDVPNISIPHPLLDDIRKAAADPSHLKPTKAERSPKSASVEDDPSRNILTGIRAGVALRHVSLTDKPKRHGGEAYAMAPALETNPLLIKIRARQERLENTSTYGGDAAGNLTDAQVPMELILEPFESGLN